MTEFLKLLGRVREKAGGARKPPKWKWFDWVASIFIEAIDRNCVKKEIRSELNKFGTIVDIHIPRKLGVGRGFTFVCFKQVSEAEFLLKSNLEIFIEGRTISLAWAWRSVSPRNMAARDAVKDNVCAISLRVIGDKGK